MYLLSDIEKPFKNAKVENAETFYFSCIREEM